MDPKLLYPLKHRGEDSQAHMAIIRSRQALIGCRTQLVNPGCEERSSPSVIACPSARPEASTTKRPSTSPRHSGRPWVPSWSRGRLAYPAHPRLRSPVGGDLQGELPRNRSLATGRRDRAAHGADLRAHLGGSLPLPEEPQCRSIPGACASQGSVGDGDPREKRISKEGEEMLSVGFWWAAPTTS